jgi:hypothetical protein
MQRQKIELGERIVPVDDGLDYLCVVSQTDGEGGCGFDRAETFTRENTIRSSIRWNSKASEERDEV